MNRFFLQWIDRTDDEAHREFMRVDRPELVARIDAAVPGIERPGVKRFRLHRSVDFAVDSTPGCVVVIQFETDGEVWAERLVDEVVARQDKQPFGASYAHFHISKDGDRMLNYVGFRDAEAHETAVNSPAMTKPGGIFEAIGAMSGVTGLGFKRYELRRSLANPEVTTPAGRTGTR